MDTQKIYDNYNNITIIKNKFSTWVYNSGATTNISNDLLYFEYEGKLDFDYYLEKLIEYSDGLLNEVKDDQDFIDTLRCYFDR